MVTGYGEHDVEKLKREESDNHTLLLQSQQDSKGSPLRREVPYLSVGKDIFKLNRKQSQQ